MKYFWTYETELPSGVGFSHFGAEHWSWLFLLAAAAFAGGIVFVGAKQLTQLHIQVGLSAAMLLVELIQDGYLALTGYLTIYQLPLHLCGLSLFLTAARNYMELVLYKKKNAALQNAVDYLSDVQYALCLPGALSALLFPDWVCYPAISFMAIVGFVNHGLLVASGCYLLLEKTFSVNICHIWKPITFLCLLIPIMYAFDTAYGLNYMFLLRGSPGSPLVWIQQEWGGYYLVGYGLMVAMVMIIWYLFGMGIEKVRKVFI